MLKGYAMVRSELVGALKRSNPDLDPRQVEQIVDLFFDTITGHLAKRGRVELRGFGVFFVAERDGRLGRNPTTGEQVVVNAKCMARFRTSKLLQSRYN